MTGSVQDRRHLTGRLLEIDFKDGTAEIYDAVGKLTRVRFSPEMAPALKDAATEEVVAEGTYEPVRGSKEQHFVLSSLSPADVSSDFWRNPSLEDLRREQGVQPIGSAADLAAPSLIGENAEALIAELDHLYAPR